MELRFPALQSVLVLEPQAQWLGYMIHDIRVGAWCVIPFRVGECRGTRKFGNICFALKLPVPSGEQCRLDRDSKSNIRH